MLYIIHSLFIVTLVYGLKVRTVMDYNLDEERGNSQKNLNCKGNKKFETSTEERFQFRGYYSLFIITLFIIHSLFIVTLVHGFKSS